MGTTNDPFVAFTEVQKTYDGETLVVKNLNLTIERGEFLTLLGPSGSGKTTLLKLVAAAVGSSFLDDFGDEDLHVEYEYTLSAVSVKCEFLREQDATEASGVADSRAFRSSLFNVEFSFASGTPPIVAQMRGGNLKFSAPDGLGDKQLNPFVAEIPSLDLIAIIISSIRQEPKAEVLRETLGREMRLTHRLDEGLDWLRALISDFALIFSDETDDDWCRPSLRYSGATTAFSEALAVYKGRFAELPEILPISSGALSPMAEACRRIQLRSASWTLSLLEQSHQKVDTKRYGRSQLYVTTHSGTRFPLEKLSFGQLRLFAFFLHSAMHPHVIVADELTNGMHHEMVDTCIDTIGERQAFLATQNPLLLDHLGFDSADEVQRTFILCDLQDAPGGERWMHWRNMTAEESHEFFADYQVGVQHTNDILRKRGLW